MRDESAREWAKSLIEATTPHSPHGEGYSPKQVEELMTKSLQHAYMIGKVSGQQSMDQPDKGKVTSANYMELAVRTENRDFIGMEDKFADPKTIRLLHAAMGLCTEAGELMDVLKRHIFYGKPIDWVNVVEELGDSCWYLAIAFATSRVSMEDGMRRNIAKLMKRYPDKFSEMSALVRDLDAEREALNGGE